MKIFDDTDTKSVFRGKFASELAMLAGADLVYMGFYDCGTRRFADGWAGFNGGRTATDGQIVRTGAEIAQVLTGLQIRGPEPAFEAQEVRSENYAIAIGEAAEQLVPVMALRGAAPGNALQLGLSYVAQQLSEAQREAPLAREEAIETALGVLSIHLAVVDAYGEIDYCTDLSSDWLRDYGGFEISLNRLSAKTQKLQKSFHQALSLATGSSRQASIVPVDADKRLSRIAVVMPLEKSNPPRALVILEQGNKDPELGDHLLKLSGLTNSECRIAHHLLEGKSLNEIADETNLSLSTVRSYLKGIFAKTSTHRQGQFITYFHNTVPRVKYIPPLGGDTPKQVR